MVARFYMLTELVACSGVVFTQSVATISTPMKCHSIDISLIGRRWFTFACLLGKYWVLESVIRKWVYLSIYDHEDRSFLLIYYGQIEANDMHSEPLPGVLVNREKGRLFQRNRERNANFEGNRGTKTILGNREHKKTHFWYWILGNRGTSYFYYRGTREEVLPPL